MPTSDHFWLLLNLLFFIYFSGFKLTIQLILRLKKRGDRFDLNIHNFNVFSTRLVCFFPSLIKFFELNYIFSDDGDNENESGSENEEEEVRKNIFFFKGLKEWFDLILGNGILFYG